jgi:phosphoglycolate phosphatase
MTTVDRADVAVDERAARAVRADCRLVIFDFDGTLADSFPWFVAVLDQVAARWRFSSVAPGEEELLRAMSARAILRHLRMPGWKTPLVAADLRRRMRADIDQIRRFDGVDAMLARLHHSGLELAVATSNSADNVRRVLGADNLRLIRHLETGAAIHGKAPRLRRLLRRAGVAAPRALYVGDEIRDIEAARAAGIPVAAVAWGYNRPEALRAARPDLVFERLEDVARCLSARLR